MDVVPTAADEKRFWSKVEKIEGGCWIWTAGKVAGGYGHITFRRDGKQVDQLAHRLAYQLLVGPIPEGLEIDHLCRNRACVNPEHMEAVTSRVNTLRGNTRAAANLAKTHCHRGHELNEANVYRGKNAPNQRICRECNRIKCRKYYRSKKGKK
ncbi:MAG: HNH endonuclease [Pirellula sp.]|nr:HNH endonuclease [Pirellula sp.]